MAALQSQLAALTKTNTALNHRVAELEATNSKLMGHVSESQQQVLEVTAAAKEDGERRVEAVRVVAWKGLDECGRKCVGSLCVVPKTDEPSFYI